MAKHKLQYPLFHIPPSENGDCFFTIASFTTTYTYIHKDGRISASKCKSRHLKKRLNEARVRSKIGKLHTMCVCLCVETRGIHDGISEAEQRITSWKTSLLLQIRIWWNKMVLGKHTNVKLKSLSQSSKDTVRVKKELVNNKKHAPAKGNIQII